MKGASKYQPVNVPKSLLTEIRAHIADNGYVSISDFVRSACRTQMAFDSLDYHVVKKKSED